MVIVSGHESRMVGDLFWSIGAFFELADHWMETFHGLRLLLRVFSFLSQRHELTIVNLLHVSWLADIRGYVMVVLRVFRGMGSIVGGVRSQKRVMLLFVLSKFLLESILVVGMSSNIGCIL